MNDITIATERADSAALLDEEVELSRHEVAARGPECACLHDPDGIEVQKWDSGWPCGKPATHRVLTECDCGAGCPDRSYLMCLGCVNGAIEHGGVISVEPL